jgi:hypothetical protein
MGAGSDTEVAQLSLLEVRFALQETLTEEFPQSKIVCRRERHLKTCCQEFFQGSVMKLSPSPMHFKS